MVDQFPGKSCRFGRYALVALDELFPMVYFTCRSFTISSKTKQLRRAVVFLRIIQSITSDPQIHPLTTSGCLLYFAPKYKAQKVIETRCLSFSNPLAPAHSLAPLCMSVPSRFSILSRLFTSCCREGRGGEEFCVSSIASQ